MGLGLTICRSNIESHMDNCGRAPTCVVFLMLRAYLDIKSRQCRTVNFPATVGPTLVDGCSVADLARLEPLWRDLGARAFRSPKAPSSFRRCRRCEPDRRAIGALATRRPSRVVLMNARPRHGAHAAARHRRAGQRLSDTNRSRGSSTHCGDCANLASGGEPQELEYIRKIRKIARHPQANSQRNRLPAAWFRNS